MAGLVPAISIFSLSNLPRVRRRVKEGEARKRTQVVQTVRLNDLRPLSGSGQSGTGYSGFAGVQFS